MLTVILILLTLSRRNLETTDPVYAARHTTIWMMTHKCSVPCLGANLPPPTLHRSQEGAPPQPEVDTEPANHVALKKISFVASI